MFALMSLLSYSLSILDQCYW